MSLDFSILHQYKGLKAKAAKTLFKAISNSVEKDSDIKWNFTKFLISKDGETINRYAPTTEPKDFEKDVEAMLGGRIVDSLKFKV